MMKMKPYETIARYLLGAIYLFGAVDGALQIFFNTSYTGTPDQYSFTWSLQHTTYFWRFLKLCELIGAFSLLMNYKPVLGFAILVPITSIICLVYAFEFHWYVHLVIISACSLVLFKAYIKSFRPLLDEYA
jgi:uncharacterized membrane protein YphA (DoxX/SURF4 family)